MQFIQRLTDNYQNVTFDNFFVESPRFSKGKTSHDINFFSEKMRKAKDSSICIQSQAFDISLPSQYYKRKPNPYGDSASSLRSNISRMPNAKNLVSSNKSGIIAIAQKDQVLFYSSECIDSDSSKKPPSDRQRILPRSRIQLPFIVCSVYFNSQNDGFLAVTGIKDCQVITIDPSTGKVLSKLTIDLMLRSLGEDCVISRVQWLPFSQTHLAVAAHIFVKIYNLSEDAIIPSCIITSNFGNIKDISIIPQENSRKNIQFICFNSG